MKSVGLQKALSGEWRIVKEVGRRAGVAGEGEGKGRLETQLMSFYTALIAFALLQNEIVQFWRPYNFCPSKASLLLSESLHI